LGITLGLLEESKIVSLSTHLHLDIFKRMGLKKNKKKMNRKRESIQSNNCVPQC